MNERIKELAEQAGLLPMWVCVSEPTGSQIIKPIDQDTIKHFAELVRQDEREQLRNRTYHEQQLMDGQASLLKGRTE